MVHPVEIRTPRLLIRELTLRDIDGLTGITSDPEVVRYLEFGPTSRAEAAALVDFAMMAALLRPRLEYILAVDELASGRMVGSCGFHADEDAMDQRETYFVLGHDAWGNGFGTEMVRALIAFALHELQLSRIYAVAHPDNVASVRVMERAGMAYDGDMAEAFEGEHGWLAGRRYAILAEEHPSSEVTE